MSELPNNWAWSTVGAVTEYIQRGKSPKYAETSELPVINQKCIRWTELQLQHLKYIHPEQISAWDEPRFIRPGDILWNSTGTGTVGRAYLVKEADCAPPKVVDSHVTVVRAAPGLEPRYLFNWIKSPAVQNKIEDMCDGTTNQIELSRTAIAETAIPVAPREEQTRIADHLDTLLARIKACNDHLDAIPGLLQRFRQAVLRAAVSGDLTADTRAERGWPETRRQVKLSQLGELGRGKSKHRPRNDPRLYGGLYPFIQTGDVAQSREYVYQHSQTYSEFGLDQSKLWPAGTVCITIAANIADTAVLTYPACFPDSVVGFVADPERCVNLFVKWGIDVIKGELEAFAPATAQKNINLSVLNEVLISCPSLEEQFEIVRRVQQMLAVADRLETRLMTASRQADRLAPQVLSRAFRGELLPQDPNDEPASVLLARLAAERNQPSAAPKARKARAPRAERALPSTSSPSKAMPNKSRQDEDVKGQPYLAAHLRRLGQPVDAKTLYEASELPVADFYKQLAWEIAEGHVNDADPLLEPARHAA